MAQVPALEAEGPGCTEVIAMAVAVPGSNGRKSFQPILGYPLPVLFDGKAAQQTAKNSRVGFLIIGIIFVQLPQQFLRPTVPL